MMRRAFISSLLTCAVPPWFLARPDAGNDDVMPPNCTRCIVGGSPGFLWNAPRFPQYAALDLYQFDGARLTPATGAVLMEVR